MRRGYDGHLWKDDNGVIIAVGLGADFCAEHEWGIAGIKETFGISSKGPAMLGLMKTDKIGIESRTITKGFDQIEKIEVEVPQLSMDKSVKKVPKKLFGIAQKSSWRVTQDYSYLTKSTSWDPKKDEIIGFWAESRFLFLVEDEKLVDDLLEAFKNNDIAMWLGGAGAFKNGGLAIAIVSRIPEDFKTKMADADQDSIDLAEAAELTGISKILKEAKKNYYALSPSWKDESKKEVIFWLNPQDQDINNYGWFDVTSLKEWANGEGPIPKKAKDDR